MIEIKTGDKWIGINSRDVKVIEAVANKTADEETYSLHLLYYGDEGTVDIPCTLTAEEVKDIFAKFN